MRLDNSARMVWNCFGYGCKDPLTGGDTTFSKGHFNMYPQGAGFLLTGNYIGDASLYFCPSATVIAQHVWTYYRNNAYASLSDLKAVGGTDAQAWMYGDYTLSGKDVGGANYAGNSDPRCNPWYARMWYGAYNYRMQPIFFHAYLDYTQALDCVSNLGGNDSDHWSGGSSYCGPGTAIPAHNCAYMLQPYLQHYDSVTTSPYYSQTLAYGGKIRHGMPAFKTVKQPGQRAYMTDSWTRNWDKDSNGDGKADSNYYVAANKGALCAQGYLAHRDGYNSLYGDGHVAWYGDPQQKIIWWPSNPAGDVGYDMDLALLWIEGYRYNQKECGALKIWHLFDAANGVDKQWEADY
jgi:hypothetical protein